MPITLIVDGDEYRCHINLSKVVCAWRNQDNTYHIALPEFPNEEIDEDSYIRIVTWMEATYA